MEARAGESRGRDRVHGSFDIAVALPAAGLKW